MRTLDLFSSSEEQVRRTLLLEMTGSLKYPPSLIAVEKELSSLPNSAGQGAGRRVDLICLAPGIHSKFPLYPLLLVECKLGQLDQRAFRQMMGYNAIAQAPFLCLANGRERKTYWHQRDQQWGFVPFLPSFEQLVQICRFQR